MGRPRVSDGPPLAIRLDAATRARLDALRTTLVPGLEVTLAQVVRAALTRGLDAMDPTMEASVRVADATPEERAALMRDAKARDYGGLNTEQGQAARAMKKRRPRA